MSAQHNNLTLEIIALIISIVAIFITLLRDFIIPRFKKPKLIFSYDERAPFRRDCGTHQGVNAIFIRFSVKNVGNSSAVNCRCQIIDILENNEPYKDYYGFPLNWAARPDKNERLNIARGETEFIDLVQSYETKPKIILTPAHEGSLGIPAQIPAGEYIIRILISGDNFDPYTISFKVLKEKSEDRRKIQVKLLSETITK